MKRLLMLITLGGWMMGVMTLSAKDYDVRDFGAVGDGSHIDSPKEPISAIPFICSRM